MAESRNCHIAFEILLAIFLPPLGVCLRDGCCSCEFWICVLLTILGFIPGIIYAVYAIVKPKDKHRDLSVESEGYYHPVGQP